MSSHIVKYDNSDITRFTYRNVEQYGPYHGRGWSSLNGASLDEENQGPIYNNTLQVGPLLDISIEFPFNGTAVWVYGSIRPPATSYAPLTESKYSVIGWDYAGIPAMVPYKASNVSNPVNNVNFFSVTGMPYKSYTLIINVTAATADMPYYFDYVAIEVPGPDQSSTSSSVSPSSASASGAFQTTSSAQTSASTVAAATSKSSVPKGALIGAAVGGVAVLAALLLALLYWCRRRAKVPPEYDYGSVAQRDTPPHVIPFVNPDQAAAMQQVGDRGLLFVPGLPPPDSPAPSPRLQSPAVLPSQKALAREAARQSSFDVISGAGPLTLSLDRKDPSQFQSASQQETSGPSSEAGSSSGPSTGVPMYPHPPPGDIRHILVDEEESPPAYTPS
ncbi:hypothetical protein BV20DRAFT_1053375 [Pilatotrama ljubarskyi]|nr:hypothetical protein BV20DRAFT_1053375 [Pilatotrama ljubarskyi]